MTWTDHCNLMGSGTGNHRHQHILPRNRVCWVANPQQSTESGKCVHRNRSVPIDGYLHAISDLPHGPERQGCHIY